MGPPMKRPSMHHNVVYASLGGALFALTQWGIVVVVARLGSPVEVGVVTVVTALVTPIFLFAQMGMRDGHSVDDLDRFTRADYLALRLVSSLMAVGIIGVLIFTYLVPSGVLVQATAAAFALVKLFGAQTNMNHGIFQRAERLDFVAISMISRGLLGLLAFAVCYWWTRSLVLAFLAEALAWWLCQWAVDRRLLQRLNAHVPMREVLAVSPQRMLQLARWMFPLGLAIFLMAASASVPRLVLERHVELALVGIFGAIAYVNVALNTVSGAIGTAAAARLRRLYRQGARRRFLRLSVQLTLLSAALGGALWMVAFLAGDIILQLLYGAEYAHRELFQIAIFAAALRITASPLQFALTAGQAFWRRMSNNSLTFLVAIAASLLLIPSLGVIGAAWALVVLSAANLLLTLIAFTQVLARIPSASDPSETP